MLVYKYLGGKNKLCGCKRANKCRNSLPILMTISQICLKVCGLVLPSIVLCTTSPEFYGMGSVKICFGLGQGFHRFFMGDPGFKKKNHPLQIFLKSWTQKALKKKKTSMSSWSSVLVASSSGFSNATFLQSDVLEPIWFCLEAILCKKGDEQSKLDI